MKKIKNILFIFLAAFIFTNVVSARAINISEIPEESYVIGTYLLTRDDNGIVDTTDSEGKIYDEYEGMTDQAIMMSASSIKNPTFENMIIYYKNFRGSWRNSTTGDAIETPDSFDITHVNGICIDSSCMGDAFNITFEARDFEEKVFNTKTVQLNYGDKITSAQLPSLNNRPGYKFLCWVKKGTEPMDDNSDCFDFNISITDDGDRIPAGERNLTLQIKWQPIIYTITYDNNFGESNTFTRSCQFIEEGNPNNCKFEQYNYQEFGENANYNFLGWSLTKDGKSLYQPETEMSPILGSEENITLYAIWSADEYRVIYDLVGGSFNVSDNIVNSFNSEDEKITLFEPHKLGYVFEYWQKENGEEFDGTNLPKSNLTLTAKWNPITYKFVYDGDTEDTKQEKVCTYNEEYKTKCTLDFKTREIEGKRFLGLFLEDGTKLPEYVINFTVNAEEFKVVAKYEDIKYKVTYDYKGGSLSSNDPANPTEFIFTAGEENSITINSNPLREGYILMGYTVENETESGVESQEVSIDEITENGSIVINKAGNIKVIAKWKAIEFSFVLEGQETVTCTYDQPCTLNFEEPQVAGQEFKYWYYIEDDGETTREIRIDKHVTNYISTTTTYKVYAKVGDIEYPIIYNYEGGVVTNENVGIYTLKTTSISLEKPTRTGYTFKGWEQSDNVKVSDDFETLVINSVGPVTLTAKWEVNEFTFTYKEDKKITCTYGVECKIDFEADEKEGQEFKYWYLLDGDTKIKLNTVLTNYTTEKESYTIYPEYGNKTYNITYNYAGGTLNENESNKATYTIEEKEITLKVPKLEGYSFNGWIVKNGPATVSGNTLTIIGVGDIELEADFGAITYIFNYAYNNQTKNCTYDELCTLDFVPEEITGKKFIGLYIVDAGKEIMLPEFITNFTTVSNTYEVKAKYEDIKYFIYYNLNGGLGNERKEFTFDSTKENSIEVEVPTRVGYTFSGWTSVEPDKAEVISNTEIKVKEATDVKIKANWSAIEYTLKYTEDKQVTCRYDEECHIDFTAEEIPGKIFKYWYTGEGETKKVVPEYVTNFTAESEAINLTPYYEDETYNIHYEYNGGKVTTPTESANKKTYTVTKNTTELDIPTKKGYKFTNWTIEGEADVSENNTLLTMTGTGDIKLTAEFEPIKYILKYTEEKQVECIYDEKCTISFEPDSIIGQEFKNWTTTEGENKTVVPNYITNYTDQEETIMISPEYSLIKYNVTYNYNDGGAANNNVEFVTYDIAKVGETNENTYSLTIPTKEGYIFNGWDVTGNAETSSDGKILTITSANDEGVTLTAKWTERQITIVYNVDGLETEDACLYTNCQIKAEIPSKEKYEFDGWTAENGTVYQASSKINIGASDRIVLTAKWTNSYRYTITYDLAKGEYAGAGELPRTYLTGTTITVPSPTREGYIFNGWKLGNDVTETTPTEPLVDESTILTNQTGDIKLTADWTPINYYFLTDGQEKITCTYDVDCPITFNNEVTGKTFTGFYVDNKVLPDTVRNYTTTKDAEFNVEIRHTNNTYAITYNYNGGAVNTNNKSSYTIEDRIINLTTPTKEGYTFGGWSIPENRGTINGNEITITGEEDIEITANWTANIVTFTYNGVTISCTYDTDCQNTFTQANVTGKIAKGLYVVVDGKEVELPSDLTNFTTENKEYTVQEKYDLISYNINYNYDGGEVTNNPTTYDVEHNIVTLNVPQKVGYTFKGWNVDSTKATVSEENANVFTINVEAINEETLTFTATWEALGYNINFYKLNGTEEELINSVSCTYDASECSFGNHQSAFDEFTRLLGWSLTKGGNLFYGDNLTVKNLSNDGSDINLYAVTEDISKKYNIYYNTDGGTIDLTNLPSIVLENNKIDTLPTEGTKEGYTFAGWVNAATGETFTNETPVVTNLVLVAKWNQIVKYTINYDVDGGTIDLTDLPTEINEGSTITLPSTGTKEGYRFLGWVDTETDELVTSPLTINKNTSLKAKWEEIITYTVEYKDEDEIEVISSETVEAGKKATKPVDPTKEGYTFLGWLLNGETYNFEDPVNSDITLVASWEAETPSEEA